MEFKRIESDDDFDGVGSAYLIARHFGIPKEKIRFSGEKIVESDEKTLVLDKQTTGNGKIIDHHPLKPGVRQENFLIHDPSGRKPTTTLVYEYMKKMGYADNLDLLIAGIAEIADGLDEFGIKDGAIAEIRKKYPEYFEKSPYKNHWGRNERIYTIAGIFYMLAKRNPEKAYLLLEKFEIGDKEEEILKKANKETRETIERYLKFCEKIEEYVKKFPKIEVNKKEVYVFSSEEFEFAMELLGYLERKNPGNYILLKPERKEISIRAKDEKTARELTEEVARRLGKVVKGYGGRVRWWGMKLKEPLGLEKFLSYF